MSTPNPPDDFEDRLRQTLRGSATAEPADTISFLDDVHRGASKRRTRRRAATSTLAALAIVGVGAVGVTVVRDSSHGATVASDNPNPSSSASSASSGSTDPASSAAPTVPVPGVQESAKALSLTATGSDHQWVLTAKADGSCGQRLCAAVLSTTDGGANWYSHGSIGYPTEGADYSSTVQQVRFVHEASGMDDGWAYGGNLVSTHDSGRSWGKVGIDGTVSQLEAWGGDVYAIVVNNDTASLYRSPVERDRFSKVSSIGSMRTVTSLVTARDVVGLIADTSSGTTVKVSRDGTTWQTPSPCPDQTSPTQLSAAADDNAESLWLVCDGPAGAAVVVSSDEGNTWTAVDAPSGELTIGARTPDSAIAIAGGSIVQLTKGHPAETLSAEPAANLQVVGFTNSSTGYLIGTDGTVWQTVQGGLEWHPYIVGD